MQKALNLGVPQLLTSSHAPFPPSQAGGCLQQALPHMRPVPPPQAGSCLQQALPHLKMGASIAVHLEITKPFGGTWAYPTLLVSERSRTCFVLSATGGRRVQLKGGFHGTRLPDGSPGLLFAGCPYFQGLDDFRVS